MIIVAMVAIAIGRLAAAQPAGQQRTTLNLVRFNWYPGIDAAAVKSQLDEATWQKLFVDVTPEDLAAKGKPFPIAPYFNDILESYERRVQ